MYHLVEATVDVNGCQDIDIIESGEDEDQLVTKMFDLIYSSHCPTNDENRQSSESTPSWDTMDNGEKYEYLENALDIADGFHLEYDKFESRWDGDGSIIYKIIYKQ